MNINKVTDFGDYYRVNNATDVPKIESNPDYQLIMAWIAEGNTPEMYLDTEPTYTELRQAEYPTLAEQLDMLYWDSVNKTNKWAETIADIKDKYPKQELV